MIEAWCHKCNKPVDEVRRESTFNSTGADRYGVICHGERQEQELPLHVMLMVGIAKVRIDAFRDVEALPEPPQDEAPKSENK